MSYTKAHLQSDMHDARKYLNQISMQAELLSLLATGPIDEQELTTIATKVSASAKTCSEQLQTVYNNLNKTLVE
jgi:arsenate reductase-like glutaredoxin family protein